MTLIKSGINIFRTTNYRFTSYRYIFYSSKRIPQHTTRSNYTHRRFSTYQYLLNEGSQVNVKETQSTQQGGKSVTPRVADQYSSESSGKKTTSIEEPVQNNANPNTSTDTTTAPLSTIGSLSSPLQDSIFLEPTEIAEDQSSDSDFLTTIFDNIEPYLDTYEVYSELIAAGFTPSQADEILNLLIVQLNSKLSKLCTKYSQEYELENEKYLFESAQQELRVDVTRYREQQINELITLINILERDFSIISDELNNDFLQMKNDAQVAINDQKSENTLQSKRIILKIQETNHKITTELNSAMRSEIESLRWHLSRWGVIAILLSVFSACTAFYAQKAKTTREEQSRSEFIPLVIYEPSEYDEEDYDTDLDRNLSS
ncbi:uncharacterized protein RJT20DRAFT_125480 [Scheffersomyces xylosifermentans]|uniref:uncharacterized protein n=1 Tax=Scheffersomyces xylosifermentans TaxID=1304137 RepID=UPI00315C72D7